MRGMALGAIFAFLLYRCISSYLVYKHTKKWWRVVSQFLGIFLLCDVFKIKKKMSVYHKKKKKIILVM